MNNEKNYGGLEASAGEEGTSPAKASSPAPLSTIHYPLSTILRGTLKPQEPLSKHTTWRVGGPAEWFYEPADVIDLAHFMQQLPPDIPVFWMGLGSNLLVRDGGITGVVIHTKGLLNTIEWLDNQTVYAQAGVSVPKLARVVAQNNLTGIEFLAGIPGTLGGALALNAGAYGGNIWTYVTSVETLDRHGQRHERTKADYEIGYRQVKGPPNEWFIAATLRLMPYFPAEASSPGATTPPAEASSPAAAEASSPSIKIKALLQKRNETQPIGLPSCGSVFRNPPGDYAGRLIEQAGWKGKGIGGAYVSEKHANFIINQGNATAKDIETLMEQIRESVLKQYGISLVAEVHIVGKS